MAAAELEPEDTDGLGAIYLIGADDTTMFTPAVGDPEPFYHDKALLLEDEDALVQDTPILAAATDPDDPPTIVEEVTVHVQFPNWLNSDETNDAAIDIFIDLPLSASVRDLRKAISEHTDGAWAFEDVQLVHDGAGIDDATMISNAHWAATMSDPPIDTLYEMKRKIEVQMYTLEYLNGDPDSG